MRQGVLVGVGGACNHIKAFNLLHSHIKEQAVPKTYWASNTISLNYAGWVEHPL